MANEITMGDVDDVFPNDPADSRTEKDYNISAPPTRRPTLTDLLLAAKFVNDRPWQLELDKQAETISGPTIPSFATMGIRTNIGMPDSWPNPITTLPLENGWINLVFDRTTDRFQDDLKFSVDNDAPDDEIYIPIAYLMYTASDDDPVEVAEDWQLFNQLDDHYVNPAFDYFDCTSFGGDFENRTDRNKDGLLEIQGGTIWMPNGSAVVGLTTYPMPTSGTGPGYISLAITVDSGAPVHIFVTGTVKPDFWEPTDPNITNVLLGELVEIGATDVWQWCERHRGDIYIEHGRNNPGGEKDRSYSGEHIETVRPDTDWDRFAQGTFRGYKMTVEVGTAYYDVGDEVLYGFQQDLTFDMFGHLIRVSDERRYIIDTPEPC